jgi:hypothetical protein
MKHSEVIEEIKGNNFPFGLNFKNEPDIQLQIWEKLDFEFG